jgi:Co/Zn/Cd efflux system component
MFVALGFLLGLVALASLTLVSDSGALPLLLPFLAAGGIFAIALKLPPFEAQRFGALVRPLVIGAAIPALLMLLQMAPVPAGLAHPVWASVGAGFSIPVGGSISVDIGATALALLQYLTLVGAMLLAAAVTINRDRAEILLVALTAATVAISLAQLAIESFGAPRPAASEEALDCACLGVTLATACALLVFERHETRRAKLGLRDAKFIYPMLASLAALIICAAAIGAARSGSLIFAACCGLGMFCAVFLVRRLNLGRWGAGAIGLTASVIVIALVSGAAGTNSDPRLAFVRKEPMTLELTQRILADAPLLGVGGGAFSSILPIYEFGDVGTQERGAVTAAAKLSIEMGRAALWAAVIAAAIAVAALLRASAQRGRDSFYAAAAASCLISLIVLAFVNVSLFGATLPVLAVVILGLGIAQSQGRVASTRREPPAFPPQ